MAQTTINYTDADLKYILDNYKFLSYGELAEKFNCSAEDIHQIIFSWKQTNVHYPLARIKYEQVSERWKKEVFEYYKTHSLSNTTKYFYTYNEWVRQILIENNFPEHDRATSLNFSKIEQCGSIEEYNKQMVAKVKETSTARYGADNFAKTSMFLEKAKQTSQLHYGVDNPMQSEIVKQTLMQNNLEKTGHAWPQQNPDVLDKRLATYEERYGGIGWASPHVRELSQQTFMYKYGADHWVRSPELIEKVKQNCFDKEGVYWPCLYPNVRLALSNDSKPNQEFANLLEINKIEFTREFGLQRYSFDFKVGNNLIEIDPAPTHNSTWGTHSDPTPKYYHRDKTATAEKHNFRCIHIFDWDDIEKVIMLLSKRQRIFARHTVCKEISDKHANTFLQQYHLQGFVKSDINLGLYYNDELVSVMTFGKPRYNKKFEYELHRYASMYQVVGGAEKLFKYFVNNYKPTSIVSYCDKSKFKGDVYTNLGFKQIALNVGKHWYNMSTKQHITDNLLRQRGFDQLFGTTFGKGTSNETLMLEHKFVEIYDAGQATFAWYANQVD